MQSENKFLMFSSKLSRNLRIFKWELCYDEGNIRKKGCEMMKESKKLSSEMRRYTDPVSGREVYQLTASGKNWHFYFTDNAFTTGDHEVVYFHSDGEGEEGIELHAVDLASGERSVLSDFASRFRRVGNLTKTADSKTFVFVGDGDAWRFDRESGELTLLYRAPVGFVLGQSSISRDGRYAVICANDIPPIKKKNTQENYGGFKEAFYGHKVGLLILMLMDGSGGEVIHRDTHWLGHVQFAPDTNEYLTFCHEGPWNYVQQRIWLLNTLTRHASALYPQGEHDSVGHEFWCDDGTVFFDNRGRGHDGTITSDKTQAVTIPDDGEEDIPLIGFADKEGRILRTVELPYYCNHYHANRDNTCLVADAVNDIVLISLEGETPAIETLAEHATSWRFQRSHPHPTWSRSNNAILYASDRDREGYPQLYLIPMD